MFFLNLVCIALLALLVIVIVKGREALSSWQLLALFFSIYFADNLLIVAANRFAWLQIIPNHTWEGFLVCGWSGKLYSIVLALALLPLVKQLITKEEIGWTLLQRPGSLLPALTVMMGLSAWALAIGCRSPQGKFDTQTLLYLTIMPGLNEELVYRGYLLGVLDKLLPVKVDLWRAPVGWGVILTSLVFGLLHSFWLDENMQVHFETIAFFNTTFSGFIFAWLKKETGSLLIPIAAHGLEDFLFFLPRMV